MGEDWLEETGFLGSVLADTIRESSGEHALATIEQLQVAASDRRAGQPGAGQRMKDLIAGLDHPQLRVAIRAFTVYLDLLNLTEDRRRLEVLDRRARHAYPAPRNESIREAITKLREAGLTNTAAQALVQTLQIKLVFTAHPTEAKRRSVRGKLREIRNLMHKLDTDLLPQDRDQAEELIRMHVAMLWQTDFIRAWRPSVMQEVGRGLSFKPVLWDCAPQITADLRSSLKEAYGDAVRVTQPCVSFGTWIGGDRDGHPGVTADVTEETFAWLRREAISFHLRACDELMELFSLSTRQFDVSEGLSRVIEASRFLSPEIEERLATIPPGELCRQWLAVIRWRLEQTQKVDLNGEIPHAAYRSACELGSDVSVLHLAIISIAGSQHTAGQIERWQTQIDTFGFHLAALDVRQNASIFREVVDEVLQQAGYEIGAATDDDQKRCELLQETLQAELGYDSTTLSPMAQETLALFRTLHRVSNQYTQAAIGSLIISMTNSPSDVLTVLWLWSQAGTAERLEGRSVAACPPIVPLLETIEDLKNGEAILERTLEIAPYREHLGAHDDSQIIMLGYSDSTKDGGYLAACWSLHQAQQNLVNIAAEHDVQLTFFHGRGGSLGRGGGPTARSIMSLPKDTFKGRMLLTEQGEVLADRYDDPLIAYRHLEQVVFSSLLAAGMPRPDDEPRWYGTMEAFSKASLATYRELLERPGFVDYFRCATPISEIEQLPIGSRPSRRTSEGGLESLRAIPWVFSWTQSRCLIPAWYGIGSAMSEAVSNDSTLQQLREMYQQWPFFKALIDNAELALAKSDLEIAAEYAQLAEGREDLREIAEMITGEFTLARRVVLAITEYDELLDGTPWLKEAIRVRNHYIDPLNLIQVELLRRSQQVAPQSDDAEELRHLTRLSINGVAAGMRTSG